MNAFVQVFEEEKNNADPRLVFTAISQSIAKNGSMEDLQALVKAYQSHMNKEDVGNATVKTA